MIDIHCHILPGLDDGAQTITDSLDMAEEAVREGISSIIATPHHNQAYHNTKDEIILAVNDLNNRLKEAKNSIGYSSRTGSSNLWRNSRGVK